MSQENAILNVAQKLSLPKDPLQNTARAPEVEP